MICCHADRRTHHHSKLAITAFSALALAAAACNMSLPGAARNGTAANLNAAPSAANPQVAGGAADAMRAIEEADVLKIQDGRAYVLNQFKGLFIIDVSNPDAPSILGSLSFSGRPVEMYVEGPRAYVVASSDYAYYAYGGVVPLGAPGVGNSVAFAPQFDGSRIKVIDISDPTKPQAMGDINLVGYANASRRVGDVIYVIGSDLANNPITMDGPPGMPVPTVPQQPDSAISSLYPQSAGFVASINIADPSNIQPVQRERFNGAGLNLAVSQTALYAASTDYGLLNDADSNAVPQELTHVQYVDISDPAGKIALRDSIRVPGVIQNRFFMDEFDGVLRIATQSFGFGFQKARVFTYDLSNPDAIQPLGQTLVIRGEQIKAVAFEGPRGYVVTFLQRDPLFVVDLADPTKPAVTGQLSVPGFSTHIDPRGNQLVAVGIDDTNANRPAVALYDVSDVKHPKQISRIVIGPAGQYVNSAATYDEKAFKIVEELGLIVIPFNFYKPIPPASSQPTGASALFAPYYPPTRCVSAVQLIDYSTSGLAQRGAFEHRGAVERVGAVGTRAYAMSQYGLQTVNIDDRDHPVSLAVVPFLDPPDAAHYDDCGNYIGPTYPDYFPFPNIDPQALLAALDAYLNAGGNCGAIDAVPMAGLVGFAGFVGLRRRARRRR